MSEVVQVRRGRGRTRLGDKATWMESALKMIATNGVDAVRVETLCAGLSVSKGAFYSLFKTRDGFLSELLDYWRQESTEAVIALLTEQSTDPKARLESILHLSTRREDAKQRALMEMAIRIWGNSYEPARKTMEEIDTYRIRFFEKALTDAGIDPLEAKARALMIYGFVVIDGSMPGERDQNTIEMCRSLLAPVLKPS